MTGLLSSIRRRRAGFTLVEIMVVILVISVLLAIAVPQWLRAREAARARSCQSNLRKIETAKEQWAMDNKKTDDATPTMAELVTAYIKTTPVCPSDGTYTLGNMSTQPACSVGGTPGAYNYHGL